MDSNAGMDDMFLRAKDRVFTGLDEREWSQPWMFMQLADPQFGMWNEEQEIEMAQLAVEHINRLKPKFVIVCGNIINDLAKKTTKRKLQKAEEHATNFKSVMNKVDPQIPLVCLCGNHDVGDLPDRTSIELYKSRFGDDYLEFWAGGSHCIVINTPLVSGPSKARAADKGASQELADEQSAWLEEVLSIHDESPNQEPVFVFSHCPPFVFEPDEPKGHFNLEPELRKPLLQKFKGAGVSKWFCGHYHRNAGGWDEQLEVVVTASVGCIFSTRESPNQQQLLDVSGLDMHHMSCSRETSGLRCVCITQSRHVHHKFFTLDAVPNHIDPSAMSPGWPGIPDQDDVAASVVARAVSSVVDPIQKDETSVKDSESGHASARVEEPSANVMTAASSTLEATVKHPVTVSSNSSAAAAVSDFGPSGQDVELAPAEASLEEPQVTEAVAAASMLDSTQKDESSARYSEISLAETSIEDPQASVESVACEAALTSSVSAKNEEDMNVMASATRSVQDSSRKDGASAQDIQMVQPESRAEESEVSITSAAPSMPERTVKHDVVAGEKTSTMPPATSAVHSHTIQAEVLVEEPLASVAGSAVDSRVDNVTLGIIEVRAGQAVQLQSVPIVQAKWCRRKYDASLGSRRKYDASLERSRRSGQFKPEDVDLGGASLASAGQDTQVHAVQPVATRSEGVQAQPAQAQVVPRKTTQAGSSKCSWSNFQDETFSEDDKVGQADASVEEIQASTENAGRDEARVEHARVRFATVSDEEAAVLDPHVNEDVDMGVRTSASSSASSSHQRDQDFSLDREMQDEACLEQPQGSSVASKASGFRWADVDVEQGMEQIVQESPGFGLKGESPNVLPEADGQSSPAASSGGAEVLPESAGGQSGAAADSGGAGLQQEPVIEEKRSVWVLTGCWGVMCEPICRTSTAGTYFRTGSQPEPVVEDERSAVAPGERWGISFCGCMAT